MLKILENTGAALATAMDDLPLDQIVIEGLVLPVSIGVFDHEYEAPQSIRIDIAVEIAPLRAECDHDAQNIVRYDYIVRDVKAHIAKGHIELVESLAEDIAVLCLSYDRAQQVCVSVAKLTAFEEAEAVGVKITRRK